MSGENKISELEYQAVSQFAISHMLRSKTAESVAYFKDVVEPELKLMQNPRFVAFVNDVAINTCDSSTKIGTSNQVNIPVLDRFRDLLVRLHSPNKRFADADKAVMRDMEFTLNLSENQKKSAFNLIADPEYALRYQVAALAKHHNVLGGIDPLIKEFARICVDLGNRTITSNLERVLNAEISIAANHKEESLLQNYKEMNHEVNPKLLA